MLASLLAVSLWVASQEPRPGGFAAPVSPLERIADPLATDLALIGLGSGFDLLSTDYALHNSSSRCVEGNPIGQRVEGRVALKIGGAAIRGSVAYYLRRHGHKTTADVFRWAGLALDGGVTAHNLACAWRK